MPTVKLESRITKQWGDIGFQGEDPKTDFRGMGLLGLINLVWVQYQCKGLQTSSSLQKKQQHEILNFWGMWTCRVSFMYTPKMLRFYKNICQKPPQSSVFFLGCSKTLHFSSVWHYLVDLLVYLESSSFYKVHFWFWPRFMLKNSVIVESRTATCPLSGTTKFSERFSQFMLFSQEDTIGQHKTCVLFFLAQPLSLWSVCPQHTKVLVFASVPIGKV